MAESDMTRPDRSNETGDGLSTPTSEHAVSDDTGDTTIGFSRDAAAQLSALDADTTAEEQEAIAALPSGSALRQSPPGPTWVAH